MGASGQDDPAAESLREEAFVWLGKIRGDLDPEVQLAFQAWYDADPKHAEIFESVLATWQLNQIASKTPAARQTDRLAKYAARRNLRRFLTIAASLVLGLAVIAGIGLKWIAGSWSSPVRQERLASGSADIRTMSLPDGSRVTLDVGSVVTVHFSARERRVTLEQGRARFDVAHDADHPFVVSAGSREVVAHGTVFDVDLRDGHLAVSLMRGSVEVRGLTEPGAKQHGAPARAGQFLLPGQRLSVEKGDDAPEPVAVPADEADWTTPMLTFDNSPLSEVIASANRYGSRRIVLAEPSLQTLRYSGTLRGRDSMDLAHMIAASFGLEVARDEEGAIRLARRN